MNAAAINITIFAIRSEIKCALVKGAEGERERSKEAHVLSCDNLFLNRVIPDTFGA